MADHLAKGMGKPTTDLVVLFENEAWQQPLFEALKNRGLSYTKYDLRAAAFGGHDPGQALFQPSEPKRLCAWPTPGDPVHAGASQEATDSRGTSP